MKRFVLIMLSIFTCAIATAATETINWYVDDQTYATTTCQTGGDIILPTTPTKYGYTFQGWSEYIPIEYLESTGTQWIDTGIVAKSSIRLLLSVLVPEGDTHENLGVIFGGRSSSGKYWAMFFPHYSSSSIRFDYYSTTEIICSATRSILGEVITIDMNYNHTVSMYDKNRYLLCKRDLSTGYFNTGAKLLLFGVDNKDTGQINITISSRLYSAQLYDNDILVRDFIPVLDKNGTPCLYDKVESKFYYNAGTGQFIAGPIIN